MIDFEELVEELLLCEAISNETGIQPIKDVHSAIAAVFHSTPPPPTDPSFYNTVQNNIFTRGSAYPLSEDDMIPQYPYIDYLCYINELVRGSGSTNIKLDTDDWASLADHGSTQDIQLMSANWISYFKGTGSKPVSSKPNPHPILDYLPRSVALQGLRAKLIEILLSKGVLGKIAIKNYIDNNYNLAEAVNSAVSLGQSQISIINRKQEDKNLNNLLLNPQQYAIGGATLSSGVKQIQEKYRGFQDSIFAIARALPGYAQAAAPLTPEQLLHSFVKNIQQNSTSITEAKLIMQQLEAMSNRLPGQKQIAQRISGALSGAAQVAKGLSLGVPTMGR